jgi:hypothetical protein
MQFIYLFKGMRDLLIWLVLLQTVYIFYLTVRFIETIRLTSPNYLLLWLQDLLLRLVLCPLNLLYFNYIYDCKTYWYGLSYVLSIYYSFIMDIISIRHNYTATQFIINQSHLYSDMQFIIQRHYFSPALLSAQHLL